MNIPAGTYYAKKTVLLMSGCMLGIGLILGIKIAAVFGGCQ